MVFTPQRKTSQQEVNQLCNEGLLLSHTIEFSNDILFDAFQKNKLPKEYFSTEEQLSFVQNLLNLVSGKVPKGQVVNFDYRTDEFDRSADYRKSLVSNNENYFGLSAVALKAEHQIPSFNFWNYNFGLLFTVSDNCNVILASPDDIGSKSYVSDTKNVISLHTNESSYVSSVELSPTKDTNNYKKKRYTITEDIGGGGGRFNVETSKFLLRNMWEAHYDGMLETSRWNEVLLNVGSIKPENYQSTIKGIFFSKHHNDYPSDDPFVKGHRIKQIFNAAVLQNICKNFGFALDIFEYDHEQKTPFRKLEFNRVVIPKSEKEAIETTLKNSPIKLHIPSNFLGSRRID